MSIGRILLLFAVVSAGLACRANCKDTLPAVDAAYGTLRVVQRNIGHFAMGTARNSTVTAEESAARACEYRAKIDELGADILGVSEYSDLFDIAGTPSTNAVFAAFPTRIIGPQNAYQCNAVFSKLPCVRSEVVNYHARHQQTYFLDAVFLVGTNEVHFVQTHLDWSSCDMAADARPRQIRQIIEHFRDVPRVIISGDWNVYGAGEYYPLIMAGYTLANCGYAGCLNTVPKFDKRMPCRRFPLDNVAVRGFRVGDVFLDDVKCLLSDHRIIGCTLSFFGVSPREVPTRCRGATTCPY